MNGLRLVPARPHLALAGIGIIGRTAWQSILENQKVFFCCLGFLGLTCLSDLALRWKTVSDSCNHL